MKQTPWFTLLTAFVLSGLVVSTTALGGQTAPSSRAVVKVAFNTKLKKSIVTDGSGRTLYMFTEDTHGTATVCTAQGPYGKECPMLWPPLTSQGAALAGKGIKPSLLGITKRTDGKRQVTYNRHPLYYFHGIVASAGDRKPGDINGQGFVGEWYVLSAKGVPIRK
jgi:predicted lipoprotein with Yx(FWY)xxD motif